MKKKKKKKKILSAEESKKRKEKQRHSALLRIVLRNLGFSYFDEARDKEFTYEGTTSDFDDVCYNENLILLIERTTLKSGISEHAKKKKVLYDKIASDPKAFLKFFFSVFPEFRKQLSSLYTNAQFQVRILYCPFAVVDETLKKEIPSVVFMDLHPLMYFRSICHSIKRSALFEFLKFLDLSYSQYGRASVSASKSKVSRYAGSLLPESHSNFGQGFKVLSFYIDPQTLLERSYVLRRDGWASDVGLYQRMISTKKIGAIRNYLIKQKRVFVNNIIVSLPSDVAFYQSNKDISKLNIEETTPVEIELPDQFNSIGLIDGQHRVYSYHEGGKNDGAIATLRHQQNLLVTGIVFPPELTIADRTKFEAQLFLEINATQTGAKSNLKQEIELMINPFTINSVAKEIVSALNRQGPLTGMFESYFFDKNKLKPTSIVSYGIRHLVKYQGDDSLFAAWKKPNKTLLPQNNDLELRGEYIKYCASEINKFLGAVKDNVAGGTWTTDPKVPDRFLTTTSVNGLIACLRRIVEGKKLSDTAKYGQSLKKLGSVKFKNYKSSQYGKLGLVIYNTCFL